MPFRIVWSGFNARSEGWDYRDGFIVSAETLDFHIFPPFFSFFNIRQRRRKRTRVNSVAARGFSRCFRGIYSATIMAMNACNHGPPAVPQRTRDHPIENVRVHSRKLHSIDHGPRYFRIAWVEASSETGKMRSFRVSITRNHPSQGWRNTHSSIFVVIKPSRHAKIFSTSKALNHAINQKLREPRGWRDLQMIHSDSRCGFAF